MAMRAPVATRHNHQPHRTRMVGKPIPRTAFPNHERIAMLSAQMSKHPPHSNAHTSFQPVLPEPVFADPDTNEILPGPSIDDGDIAPDPEVHMDEFADNVTDVMEAETEKLPVAETENSVDAYHERELSYHDEPGEYNSDVASGGNVKAKQPFDDDIDDGGMQYISGSSEDDENEDEDEVSYISQNIEKTGAIVDFRHLMINKGESPAFSDSGASSAFSPAKGSSSPYQRPPSEGSFGPANGNIGYDHPSIGGGGFRPPRPGTTAGAPGVSQPSRPTLSTGGPALPRAKITVQTSTRRVPVQELSPQSHGMAVPIASGKRAGEFPSQNDSTPLVSNGRKAFVSPDSSPDRLNETEDTADETVVEATADWQRSAVNQVTNAVGTVVQIGRSLLKKHQYAHKSSRLSPHRNPRISSRTSSPIKSQPHGGNERYSELPGAMDRMNLDNGETQMGYEGMQQHPYTPSRSFASYAPSQSLAGAAYAPSSVHGSNGQHGASYDYDAASSAYGPNQSQIPTEHMSNHPGPAAATLAGALAPNSKNPKKEGPIAIDNVPSNYDFKVSTMSPIMRMRNSQGNDEQSVHSQSAQSIQSEGFFSQSVRSQSMQSHRSTMTEEEFQAMKSKAWKEKKKLADRTRAREKEKLEGPGKKRKSDRAKRKRIESDGLAGLAVGCNGGIPNGLQNLINNILDGACGHMQEEASDSNDEDEEEATVEVTVDGGSTHGESTTQVSEATTRTSSVLSNTRSPTNERPGDAPNRTISKLLIEGPDEGSIEDSIEEHEIARSENTGGFSSKVNIEKFKDKDFIKEFISNLSKEGIQVMQHKVARGNSLAQPQSVTVLLRRGTLDNFTGRFGQPHLLVHSNTDGNEPAAEIDVFDIRGIEKASITKLQAYPLSLPGNSILIRLSNKEYIFETPDEESAVRLVHGMRWLIARLSFNLIIGNASVSCELLDSIAPASSDLMQMSRAMNDVSHCLADKATQFLTG